MYTVPGYVQKVRLISRDGIVAEFDNLKDAAIHLGRWGLLCSYGEVRRIGNEFYDTSISFLDLHGRSFDYVLRTEFGDKITLDELRAAHPRKKAWWAVRRDQEQEFVEKNFRNGPVPYTGNRRYGHYYRRPKTTAERRDAIDVLNDEEMKEYGIRPRAKRGFRSLPNAWDDVPCSRRGNNWKNYRKKQWKEKNG
jgi:hypothetical protein